ncbi:NADP-dependent oxidoreductase [Piscicoccus intestinalis]|uniref:NADP-dependent oxidoreductase n=1 Tax=Piscicoccus intestinalis TaxID=746033 RepID=UPI0008384C25|nr:NADP-dependent oxidoreductase [Piscicoccus intestinalis]
MTFDLSTQVQLVARPHGWPTPDDFRVERELLDELAPGQVRVVNEFISVDPYMRGRMNDAKSYVPPFQLERAMTGGAVGRVVASRSEIPVDSLVLHQQGWRDVAQGDAGGFQVVPRLPGAPSSVHLGILGMTGLTAYVGLTTIARMAPGDTVFVSGAAGAVGSAVGQFARLLGASRVVGSAGSAQKVAALTSRYGFDAALNYKDAPVREQLPQLVPDGIDVYFDNVGGDHLQAALDSMNRHGRVALCGAISGYNATDRAPGPDNLTNLITRSLTLEGFTLGDHFDKAPEFADVVTPWFREGKLAYDETVVDGIENAVQAFLDMMRGANTGKMVVRVS